MMANPRQRAVEASGDRTRPDFDVGSIPDSLSAQFGAHVFSLEVMKKMLPSKVYKNVERATKGIEKLKPEFADAIALAMKEWAVSHGATHYTHWFLPLTGASAEKHDSFIDWDSSRDGMIEKFGGEQLLQGEPDASSFPSGQLRTTFEARGYTGWDPSSPAFIWTAGDGVTLFIPSVFFSWTGEALDHRIPLLHSTRRLEKAVLRLLDLTGTKASHVHSTVGLEQEYFVIDRALRNLRPDLVLLGKTVLGAAPTKGQELQDHYFGSVKDRILRYMRDFETAAIQLGIPVKTRHNEVAPAQHEIATIYEDATLAIDHNVILMELMRSLAAKHDLVCLLHEKPFEGLNGSGKHTNWSLATDTGKNLLSPPKTPQESIQFLALLAAILNGVHRHAGLLRASVASLGNDSRLGGDEAPPAIMSVYLGEELEKLLTDIESGHSARSPEGKGAYDLGLSVIPELPKDNIDRNRTSPFAYTGSKFEFRAVGSAANVSEPVTVLNVIVAESLEEMLDNVEKTLAGNRSPSKEELAGAFRPEIVAVLKRSKAIRYAGDNYTEAWKKEAKKRGLPNIPRCADAFDAYLQPQTLALYEGVLTRAELHSRHLVHMQTTASNAAIEVGLLLDLFQTMVVPSVTKYQVELAKALQAAKSIKAPSTSLEKLLAQISELLEEACFCADKVRHQRSAAEAHGEIPLKARGYCERVLPECAALRSVVDQLEKLVSDEAWSLPKYRELLFFV